MLTALTILLAILFSAISSAVISKYSFRIAAVDVPNERSSHSIPTPRGGGIGSNKFSQGDDTKTF